MTDTDLRHLVAYAILAGIFLGAAIMWAVISLKQPAERGLRPVGVEQQMRGPL
jgi:hypothetical protein